MAGGYDLGEVARARETRYGRAYAELRARVAALEAETQRLKQVIANEAAVYQKVFAERARLEAENAQLRDAAEMLWVVLANVSGGDWTQQSVLWQDAAARWRDHYFKTLKPVGREPDAAAAPTHPQGPSPGDQA